MRCRSRGRTPRWRRRSRSSKLTDKPSQSLPRVISVTTSLLTAHAGVHPARAVAAAAAHRAGGGGRGAAS